MVLVVGIVALIGSCAKKDDDTPTTTSTTLSAPTGPTATLGYFQVAVDWTAVSGATSYTVYWDNATGVSSSSTAITGITDDNYTHTGLDNGTTYYYKIATVDSAGTGSLSSEVSATPRPAYAVSDVCTNLSDIASGDWDGMQYKDNVSGSFYFSYGGATHSNGCVNDSTFISEEIAPYAPSGTLGWKKVNTITSSTTFTRADHYYSDNECTKETGWLAKAFDNVSIGDNITIAGWPASGHATQYQPYATKISFKEAQVCLLSETEAQKALFTSWSITTVIGTVKELGGDNLPRSSIMLYQDNLSGSTKSWLNFKKFDNATYPDNWTNSSGSSGADVMYNL
jgi:hypothetical protein